MSCLTHLPQRFHPHKMSKSLKLSFFSCIYYCINFTQAVQLHTIFSKTIALIFPASIICVCSTFTPYVDCALNSFFCPSINTTKSAKANSEVCFAEYFCICISHTMYWFHTHVEFLVCVSINSELLFQTFCLLYLLSTRLLSPSFFL